jgi:hypothetical protein
MSNDSREAFEASVYCADRRKHTDKKYVNHQTQYNWTLWQAAQSRHAEEKTTLEARIEGLQDKLESLSPHGECACKYDRPNDLCMHHSPLLNKALADNAALVRKCAEICEGIADSFYEKEYHRVPELQSSADTGARACEQAILALLNSNTQDVLENSGSQG